MPQCAALGCKNVNDQDRKSKNQQKLESKVKITFHSFPKNPDRCKAWTKAMQLGDWKPKRGSYLCSLHFEENFFDRTSLSQTRLRDNAVPHITTPHIEKLSTDDSSTFHFEQVEKLNNVKYVIPIDELDKCIDDLHPVKWRKLQLIDRTTSISPERFVEKSQIIDRATSVSPKTSFDSPTKQQIRKANKVQVDYYKKKIKSLQEKLGTKDKKIAFILCNNM